MRLILALVGFPSVILASATCYFRSGEEAPADYRPCNGTATGQTGSHSSCCLTNNKDVCLTSGLCFYPGAATTTNSFSNFFADGCTDKSMQDPSCQTFCPSTSTANVQTILNCGDGNYCCVDLFADTNSTACCSGRTFKLANGVGAPVNLAVAGVNSTSTIISTATPTGSSSSGSTDTTTNTTAIVGGALGALLAVALGVITFLLWKLRRLQGGIGTHGPGVPDGTTWHKYEYPPTELSAQEASIHELPEHRT